MKEMTSTAASLVLLGLLVSCSRLPQSPDQSQGRAQISVLRDASTFDAATSGLIDIDFEDQPIDGRSSCHPDVPPFCTPISNPLVLEGVTFTDPEDLQTGFCSSPTCKPDHDNPIGGNIELALNPGGTIDFPANTRGAMLIIEGIGDNPFQIKVSDSAGNTMVIDGAGAYFDVTFLGFSSPNGVARAEVLSVGGTGGPLGLSGVKVRVSSRF